MTTDATLPAAVPLRLPPRSAYATPSSKSSKSTQRLKSSLTYYPIRPFTPLHVCMKDLTADIFQAHVEDGHQKNLFEFSSEDEDGLWLIEFGFMTHGRDTDGLLDYLQSMGIVGASATMTVDG